MRSIGVLISLSFLLILAGSLSSCSASGVEHEPPIVVLNVGSDARVEVGETLRIRVEARDPEGAGLTMSWSHRPQDRNWSLNTATFLAFESQGQAEFQWSPLPSDVTSAGDPLRLIFIVENSHGTVTERVVNVTISPGNGVPRFLNNSSELYDPRSGQPLVIDVRVRDDDDPRVDLTMPQETAPIGSTFEQTGNMEGRFTWMPTVEQLRRRVHSVTFVADDGINEVPHTVSLVIRTASGFDISRNQTEQSCPGEEVIEHTPLGPQRTLDGYRIEARLTAEAASAYDSLVVLWTLGDALNDGADLIGSDDPAQNFISLDMEREGNNFVAEIPNQAHLVQPGRVLPISYTICAVGSENSVCVPSSGDINLYWRFAVYRPDEERECIDDGVDEAGFGEGNTTFETASVVSVDRWSHFTLCQGSTDFHTVRARDQESYLIAVSFPKDRGVTVRAFDNDRQPMDVSLSSCTGLATVEVVAEAGPQDVYVQVDGDGVEYQIKAFRTQGGSGGCIDDHLEPNDTALDATPVMNGQTIEAEICDASDLDIYRIDLRAGDQLTVVNRFSNQRGNLDMTLFAPSQEGEISRSGTGVAFTFSFDDEETIEHIASETGPYYLLVFTNDTPNSYEISFAVDTAPPCNDTDMYAGNHSQSTSHLIPVSGFEASSLQLCPGQADWFRHQFQASDSVLAEVEVTGGTGSIEDVSFSIFNFQAQEVATGSRSGNRIDLSFEASASGLYYYRVLSSSPVEYRILIIR